MDQPKVDITRTDADFEQMCWHDNHIHGLHIEAYEWKSDLILDIDHIVEWVCSTDKSCRFRVAPATLVFHHVTDLRIALEWEPSGFQVSIHPVSIGEISRERMTNAKVCLDRAYYKWVIATNWPSGTISFGAVGFTQTLRTLPILCDEQMLPAPRCGGIAGQLTATRPPAGDTGGA